MNNNSPRESSRRLDLGQYLLLMAALYIFWGGFFTTSFVSQIVLNFAVFYPVGLLYGYRNKFQNKTDIYVAAVIFNTSTYLLALFTSTNITFIQVGLDYLSMFAFIGIGIFMGKHSV